MSLRTHKSLFNLVQIYHQSTVFNSVTFYWTHFSSGGISSSSSSSSIHCI